MSYFKRFLIFLLASHTLISSFFMINVYAVFDNPDIIQDKCKSFVLAHPNRFCYNIILNGLNYCPIEE